MERPFPLLSAEVLKIEKIAHGLEEPQKSNVIDWLSNHFDIEAVKEGNFDEKKMLEIVETMSFDADPSLPILEVKIFIDEFLEIVRTQREKYLRFALTMQKSRVENLLKNQNFVEADKMNRNTDRYLKSAENKLAGLNSKDQMVRSENLFNAQTAHQNGSILNTDALLEEAEVLEKITSLEAAGLVEEAERLKESLFLKAHAELSKSKKALIEKLNRKKIAEIEACKKSIQELKDKLTITQTTLLLKKALLAILDQTNVDLKALPIEEVDKAVTSGSVVQPPQKKADKKVVQDPSRSKTELRINPDKPEPILMNCPENEKNQDDIAQLRTMLLIPNLAEVRILVPDQKEKMYEKGWREIFNVLGFRGKLKFVTYHHLETTADRVMPVIVYGKMKANPRGWNKNSFENVISLNHSSLNLLLGAILKEEAKISA